jgi:mono/diheme cytochrome c family protein
MVVPIMKKWEENLLMRILVTWSWRGLLPIIAVLWLGAGTGFSEQGVDLKPRVPPDQLSKAQSLHNPHSVTKDFVARGKALYEGKAFCSACHGVDGTGKQQDVRTPLVGSPSTRNFGDAAWQAARTDGELFWILKHGSHGTDMAPYLPLYLTEEEAWQIVTYIRSFGKS